VCTREPNGDERQDVRSEECGSRVIARRLKRIESGGLALRQGETVVSIDVVSLIHTASSGGVWPDTATDDGILANHLAIMVATSHRLIFLPPCPPKLGRVLAIAHFVLGLIPGGIFAILLLLPAAPLRVAGHMICRASPGLPSRRPNSRHPLPSPLVRTPGHFSSLIQRSLGVRSAGRKRARSNSISSSKHGRAGVRRQQRVCDCTIL
jgi:hypothetical protein